MLELNTIHNWNDLKIPLEIESKETETTVICPKWKSFLKSMIVKSLKWIMIQSAKLLFKLALLWAMKKLLNMPQTASTMAIACEAKAFSNASFLDKNHIKTVDEYDKAINMLAGLYETKFSPELADEKMRTFIISIQDASNAIAADRTYAIGYCRWASALYGR